MPSETTLMRYASVRRPRLFDLAARAAADDDLRAVLALEESERRTWAREAISTLAERPAELLSRYRESWGIKPAQSGRLPQRADLFEGAQVELAAIASDPSYQRDLASMTKTALAAKLVGDDPLAHQAAAAVQFLERLPRLPGIDSRELPAPPVIARFVPQAAASAPAQKALSKQPKVTPTEAASDPEALREDVAALWVIRNRYVREKRRQLEARASAAARPAASLPRPAATAPSKPAPARSAAKAKAAGGGKAVKGRAKGAEEQARLEEQRARRQQAAEHFRAMRARNADRKKELEQFGHVAADDSIDTFLRLASAEIAATVPGLNLAAYEELKNRFSKTIKGYPGKGGKPGKPRSFCMAWEEFQDAVDAAPPAARYDPLAEGSLSAPTIGLTDRVDLLGTAELIKVEEHLIGYTEAEISYVENILAGEKRVRTVRTSDEFELTETLTEQESSSNTSEKQSTSNQSLASEVSNTIQSRFQSDVNTSANASGGGTIGVVNVEGGGSVSMGVGLGLDTSLTSTDSSEFGMEIVESAKETLTRSTISVRTSRTRKLFETLNSYEIDNTLSPNPTHRRGVYCFLNKHLCVTETPYGVRWFLKAQLQAPGRTLLEEGRLRQAIAANEVERPPEFDLSPADIHPANYQSLVQRFRAQGVAPPPAATRHLARTYKCDQSNKGGEEEKGLAKIGKSLMPMIGAYGRHLINDTIEIPEGYMVQEVRLAIDHGTNGLSLPVDLPFKLAGGAMMAVPTMMAYPIIMIPVALWQTLMLASPLLHQNTDSSAVIATVGTESQQSNYYFFEPDFLIGELLQLFGSFAGAGPTIMAAIQDLLDDLPQQLVDSSRDLADAIVGTANNVADDVSTGLGDIQSIIGGINLASLDIPKLVSDLFNALGTAASQIAARAPTLDGLFQPLNSFLQSVADILTDAAESAMSDLLAVLLSSSENSQLRAYSDSYGFTGALPVSLNIAALKPAVTLNLVACVARTERALDAWRIATFEKLHQAHLQQVAEYEGKVVFGTLPRRSPGTLRSAERDAIKTRVITSLNEKWPVPGGGPDMPIDRVTLFEHAIDWANISYRIFNYGTTTSVLNDDRMGIFAGADPAHREFLTATWGEVMLPLSGDVALEEAMLAYFENGSTAIGAGLTNDELAALWQDVILRRSTYAIDPEPTAKREIVVPTDLVVLRQNDSLPTGLPTACTP